MNNNFKGHSLCTEGFFVVEGGGVVAVLCHKVFSIINFVLIRGWLVPTPPTLEACRGSRGQ